MTQLYERTGTFLAGQPAAPECPHCKTYGKLCGVHGKATYDEPRKRPAAPTPQATVDNPDAAPSDRTYTLPPAAPARTEAVDETKETWWSIGGADVSLGSIKAALSMKKLRVVTEAEQAVLDAMGEARVASLRQLAALPEGVAYASVGKAARAELARRGLK